MAARREFTPKEIEAMRQDSRSLTAIAHDHKTSRDRVQMIKAGLDDVPRKKKISVEQALGIFHDARTPSQIAECFGISVTYVEYIKGGRHKGANALMAFLASTPAAPRRHRFYQPFRDGTYAP